MSSRRRDPIRDLDARTVLVVAVCSGIATMFARSMRTHLVCMCFLVILFGVFGLWRRAAAFLLVYALALGGLVLELRHGPVPFPSPLLLSVIYKMVPVGMGVDLLMRVPSGKLIAGLRRLPVPTSLMLIIIVMMRFAPTMLQEVSEVRDSMRVRGFLQSFGRIMAHPFATLEYAIVPTVFRSLKISDELSSSAIVRGIECPGRKESYYAGGFRLPDCALAAAAGAVCLACCL